ncbi:MAG: hypothetical protein JEY94_12570 [Melioribacteraceae bacterium]|nr:hypothetical protein [Melioribacteraceae bacterium]
MTLSLLDRSNYFKGLLLLIGKDEKITQPENDLIKKLGKVLGFEKYFVEEAINGLFENEYIKKDPPKFSSSIFAEAFLKDGIKLALADNDLASAEYEWLITVAANNNINNQWLETQFRALTHLDYEKDVLASNLEILPFLAN